jgi:2'-5' RNA ligase
MRAFVAIEVPPLGEYGTLPTHLTLKFLGEIPPEVAPPLGAGIGEAVRAVPSFQLTVEGVGAFPDPTRPRVVWAGIGDGRGSLVDLARRVDEAAAALGLPREGRPFSPHVTLFRVRGPNDLERARRALSESAGRTFTSTTVREVVLFESELRKEGAVHRAIGRFPLAAAPSG